MATKKNQGTGKREQGRGLVSPAARVPVRPVVVDAAHCWLERTNPLIGVSIRTAQKRHAWGWFPGKAPAQ